jgi:hypothetical protein
MVNLNLNPRLVRDSNLRNKNQKLQGFPREMKTWVICNPLASLWSRTAKFQLLILIIESDEEEQEEQCNNVMVIVETKRAPVNYRTMTAKFKAMFYDAIQSCRYQRSCIQNDLSSWHQLPGL